MILEVLQCPVHRYMCVAINDTRVTPGKCCGQWMTVRRWKTDGRSFTADVRNAIKGVSK